MTRLRLGLLSLAALAPFACSRHAEIRDDPDASGVTIIEDPIPDGGIPEVPEAGLEAFTACAEREVQNCLAANDFPCDFPRWIRRFISQCSVEVDCTASGWISVHMGEAGCVDSVGMTEPHPELVACLVNLVGEERCTCSDVTENVYLGPGLPMCPDPGGPTGGASEPL